MLKHCFLTLLYMVSYKKNNNENEGACILNENGDVIYRLYSSYVYVCDIQYNENGQMIKAVHWGTAGAYPESYYTYSYDEDGNLIEEIYSGYTLEYSSSLASVTHYSNFVYNDDGLLTEKTSIKEWEDGTTETAVYTYTYNSKGQLIVQQVDIDRFHADVDIDVVYVYIVQESDTYTYEYDDEGNIVADAYTAHVMYSTGQEKTYEYSNAYSYSYHTAYWYKQP